MDSRRIIISGWVSKLIVINIVIFVMQIFAKQYQGYSSIMTFYLGIVPGLIVEKGFLWQIFTYMFLHSTFSFSHIFFNMYALLIFGVPIEQTWGSRRFLLYYFYCGAMAGVTILIINLISMGSGYYTPTIGASGAIFGLLLAFGFLFPNVEILLFFILPIRAKYLVILYGMLELYLELFGGHSSVSHIGHLGGLLAGLLFFLVLKRRSISFRSRMISARSKRNMRGQGLVTEGQKGKMDVENTETKINILKKIRSSGYESLSDDEIQFIKYIDIMTDNEDVLCNKKDNKFYNDYCSDCENFNACFLKEVGKGSHL